MPDNAKNLEAVQPDTGSVVKQSGALGLGERLRSARKARAMSLEHVSETLHLDENIILALEDEQFDVLGAPVFVRGHLKAYARLVGLSPDSVLDAFHETEKLPDVVSTANRDALRSVTVNPVLWGFWALVILIGFGLGIYLILGDSTDSDRPAPVASTLAPEPDPVDEPTVTIAPELDASLPLQSEIAVPREMTTRLDDTIASPQQLLPETDSAPKTEALTAAIEKSEAEPDTVAESAPIAIDRPVRLTLYFTAESWVEISDADRRLLFGLQGEGRRRELTGEPPFSLLLGNANGVEIRLNDRIFTIQESRVSGKVARFEITRADIE